MGEFHDLYTSPNIMWMIKSRRWAGHMACMGGAEVHQGIHGGF
jgi:hypothetical protein